MDKKEILEHLSAVEENVRKTALIFEDSINIEDYQSLVTIKGGMEIWTKALQTAINEHSVIEIPFKDSPYYIDNSILIPSNRRIEADKNARICLTPDCDVLMLRNTETKDGTHFPIPETAEKNTNISIDGGIWEESRNCRQGYGKSGMYDKDRSFYGVSTCMLFNNLQNLSLTNMNFVHTAGFAVQVGNIKNALFENIIFTECFADGLHINGNSENLIIRNISGDVGDDLVALNLYDWQDSSVNFGPAKNILCENLKLSQKCNYPAMRIEPGTYFYDDGSKIDCSLKRTIIKNVEGIRTFKMYYQTPPYGLDKSPEKGEVGSCDYIYFENIKVDLTQPIDMLEPYTSSDELRGTFSAFELGANIGHLSFENIDLKLYKDKYPFSYFLCIGPKSVLVDNSVEIFDPYLSSALDELHLKNIYVNGKKAEDFSPLLREIKFDNINNDGFSTGKGEIKKIFSI